MEKEIHEFETVHRNNLNNIFFLEEYTISLYMFLYKSLNLACFCNRKRINNLRTSTRGCSIYRRHERIKNNCR